MFTVANCITSINLFCGGLAIIEITNHRFHNALCLLFIAMVADFLDGYIARMLGQASDLGKQLDSLGDVISFGLAPALIAMELLKMNTDIHWLMPFVAMILLISAAFRLGKFNITTDHTAKDFNGVPTPAMALFFFGMVGYYQEKAETFAFWYQPASLIIFIALFAYFMLSHFTILKIMPRAAWLKQHWVLLILYTIAILLSFRISYLALSLIVIFHIIYSIIYFFIYEKIYSKN